MPEAFALNSRDEAAIFDDLLAKWQSNRKGSTVQFFPLTEVWDAIQANPDEAGRIFSAVLDLKLNLAFLPVDLLEIADVLNRDLKERQPSHGILQDPAHFMERMDLLRASLDYILRYRAVWDKIMGLVVLLTTPSHYQGFVDAPRRKAKFRSIASETGKIPLSFVDEVETLLTEFDNKYRTAEAHGSGRMRKWSLVVQLEEYNPNEALLWSWNHLNDLLQRLPVFFKQVSQQPGCQAC